MISGLFDKLFSGLISGLIVPLINLVRRWVYNLDGVDDRLVLVNRAINSDGDFEAEWTQIGVSNIGGSPQTIVTQSLSATIASREFVLRWNGNNGGLQLSVGGTGLALTVPCLDGRYRVTYVGSTYTVFYNGVLSRTGTFTRGTVREPTAVTIVGCRNSAGSFTEFTIGRLFDLRINGVLWPLADRNQAIQLPSPTGLGPELITQSVLENPAVPGSQWTYLGNGRWQLVSDGSYSGLTFISPGGQPEAGFVEFEIESISGGSIRCSEGTAGLVAPSQFNTPGVKRWYFTQKSLDNRLTFSRNNSGVPVTAVIKNISFKPLWVTNATELVANGDFSSSAGWTVGPNSAITGGVLQITSAASSSVTRRDVSTDNTKRYELRYTVSAITGGAVRALVYGNGVHYVGPDRTAAGTYVDLVNFNVPGGSFVNSVNIQAGHAGTTSCTVDNISLREITSLCNPMTLINTNPDRWQEIEI